MSNKNKQTPLAIQHILQSKNYPKFQVCVYINFTKQSLIQHIHTKNYGPFDNSE